MPSSSAAVVSVNGLEKRYGSVEALRGVSFTVAPGQIFGLLGPNGAGKTTTLECILGLRAQDGGSIRIAGLDPRENPRQARLLAGAQLQAAALQDKITPRQALELFGSFYHEPYPTTDLLARFGLESKADVAFATLSGGLRQRLFLALALVNRPMLLVLDEPTAGLDPQARRSLRDLIRGLRAEGKTILLSTHDLDEAAQLCDRIVILDEGRVVAEGAPAELVARSATPARLTVRTAPALPAAAVASLPGLVKATESGASGWTLDTHAPNRLLAELVRRADELQSDLMDVELRRPSLEDVFIELTGRPWVDGSGV